MLFVVDFLRDSGKVDTAGIAGIGGKTGTAGKACTSGMVGIAGTSGTAGTSGISVSVDIDLRLPIENLLPLELGVDGASRLLENKPLRLFKTALPFDSLLGLVGGKVPSRDVSMGCGVCRAILICPKDVR